MKGELKETKNVAIAVGKKMTKRNERKEAKKLGGERRKKKRKKK